MSMGPLSRKGCFKCGEISHIAEQCASETRLCYNCKEAGHESSACTAPRTADSKQCYGCGGIGHLQSDCPSLRATGFHQPGGQKCYGCGAMGHIARSCPSAAVVAPVVPAVPVIGEDGIEIPAAPVAVATVPIVRAPHFVPRGGYHNNNGHGHRGGMQFVNGNVGRGGFMNGGGGNPGGFRGGFNGGMNNGVGGNGAVRVVRCYKCGELNHLARSCTAGGMVGGAPSNGGVPRGGPKTCYKCKEEGHIARDCPTNEVVAA